MGYCRQSFHSERQTLYEKGKNYEFDLSVQEFLLQLSIMDEFTVKQAEAVTESKQTSALLKKLNAGNAFVYYDETNKIYKIHNILLDFLRIVLESDTKFVIVIKDTPKTG